MNHRDSPVHPDEERAGSPHAKQKSLIGSRSKHEGFHNHPDDPDNPNKVRERYLQKIRSLQPH
jgi:hypothetical protein